MVGGFIRRPCCYDNTALIVRCCLVLQLFHRLALGLPCRLDPLEPQHCREHAVRGVRLDPVLGIQPHAADVDALPECAAQCLRRRQQLVSRRVCVLRVVVDLDFRAALGIFCRPRLVRHREIDAMILRSCAIA